MCIRDASSRGEATGVHGCEAVSRLQREARDLQPAGL